MRIEGGGILWEANLPGVKEGRMKVWGEKTMDPLHEKKPNEKNNSFVMAGRFSGLIKYPGPFLRVICVTAVIKSGRGSRDIRWIWGIR